MREYVVRKPKSFGAWLTVIMLQHNIEDEKMARFIYKKTPTIQNWKANRNLPKLSGLFAVIDYLSVITDRAPTDLLDDALESMHTFRKINVTYRMRMSEKKNDKNT